MGLIKQFVKALDSDCFSHICSVFPGLSNEKLKAGIFDGPQIITLTRNSNEFEETMNDVERAAWRDFVQIVQTFLGNTKAPNYIELVESMLTRYKNLGANMSIKVHFLDNHLERFPENLGDFSEEQGERFHQDIKFMEERYQ